MLFFTADNKEILSLCHVKPHNSGDHPKLVSLAENGCARGTAHLRGGAMVWCGVVWCQCCSCAASFTALVESSTQRRPHLIIMHYSCDRVPDIMVFIASIGLFACGMQRRRHVSTTAPCPLATTH